MMKTLKRALLGSVSLALSVAAFTVQAQEAAVQEDTTKPRAVLFKVHDIKPVENAEGVITECDFLVTFYNRTTDSFRDAKVEMGWTDNVTDRYVVEEEEKAEPERVTQVNRSSQRNKPVSLGEFTTTVDMPALGAYKQATVKGNVKTEKCFLLLDNLEFNVSSCNIIGKTESNTTNNNRRSRVTANRSASECSNLFQYVDSKNPEYYDEFKNISYSEQERLLSNDKAQDTTEIDSSYETIVKNFEKAESVMNNIK